MRPIDADEALQRFDNDAETMKARIEGKVPFQVGEAMVSAAKELRTALKETLDGTPTLDCAPVRHGEWKEGFCSKCGAEAAYNDIDEAIFDYDWEENLRYSHTETRREYHETPFCHNCGTKMDGGKEND